MAGSNRSSGGSNSGVSNNRSSNSHRNSSSTSSGANSSGVGSNHSSSSNGANSSGVGILAAAAVATTAAGATMGQAAAVYCRGTTTVCAAATVQLTIQRKGRIKTISASDLMVDGDAPSSALEAFKALHHPESKAAEKLAAHHG